MYRVVILDDEENIAEGIAHLFPWNEAGFEIAGCFNEPLEALRFIEENKPEVLLCDIEMPHMNGIQLAEKLKNTNIRIVYISAYQKFEYLRGAVLNRVEDYILKPIKYSDLSECLAKIREALDEENKSVFAEKEKPKGYYEQIVQRVKEYVNENYQRASLEKASEIVHLSPNYLSRIFKEYAGTGFQDYLIDVRMQMACEYLKDIRYKSYDVAFYVGYDNPKNFSRAFKKYFGKTVTEYRRNFGIIDETGNL